jgi:PhnB protein
LDNTVPIPHLVVQDGDAAIDFYTRVFGATVEEKHLAEDGKRIMHAHLAIGKGGIFLHDEFPEVGEHGGAKPPPRLGGASSVIHLDVSDADEVWNRALEAGAEVVSALENQFWGMRYGQLRDPFGHLWAIGGPVK